MWRSPRARWWVATGAIAFAVLALVVGVLDRNAVSFVWNLLVLAVAVWLQRDAAKDCARG